MHSFTNSLKKSLFKIYCTTFILLHTLAVISTQAQINKDGLPLIRNYAPEEYEASPQNWAIARDERGVMYFGNNFGLLEFNGSSWKVHDNVSSAEVYSLAVDEKGCIYYGSIGDFGAITIDSIGELTYFSIFKAISSEDADFNAIRGVHATNNLAFFRSSDKLFVSRTPVSRLKPEDAKNNTKVFVPEKSFHKSFMVRDKFYVRSVGKGLMTYENGELIFVEGSEIFADEKIYAMMPYSDDKVLIGTLDKGLFVFEPEKTEDKFVEFDCQANQTIIESYLYDGVALPNNRYALATLGNGVIIINADGVIEEHLNMKSGLPDQAILSIFYDKEASVLWFATNENGIFKANIGSPFREWGRINGLTGVTLDVARFEDFVYAATTEGVFFLDDKKEGFVKFERVKGIETECWDLENFLISDKSKRLLAGTKDGVFEITGKKAKLIANNGFVYRLHQSSANRNLVYIGFEDGFGLLKFDNSKNKWDFKGKNKAINYTIRSIYESKTGQLYLGTDVSGILKLNNFEEPEPLVIDSALGLPLEGADYLVFEHSGEIVIGCMQGLFSYDDNQKKVVAFNKFGGELFSERLGVYRVLKTIENGYLMSLYSNNLEKSKWQGVAYYKADKKNDEGFDFRSFRTIPQKVAHSIFEDGDYYWIGNDKGLYKFNKAVSVDYEKKYNLNFLQVTTTDDSLLFAGTFYEIEDSIIYISKNQINELKPELLYRNNQLTFEYSALFYEQEEKTEYTFRLVGLNEKWSKWTNETKFTYTNLPPGDFRFEVKARNIYETESNIISYEFTILPPWYMTVWAIILFVLAAIALVWLIVRLNIRRLKKEKERLERIVEERTTEIRMKNVELEQQKEEIAAQRDEIEAQRDHVMVQKEQIEAQRDEITAQHNMILEQTKSITDSIHYASRIQEALLPPEEVLNEILPEHFILYKPRDIVSGDFYWASTKNNRTIIVAADCTGHGVPGAFMSMLGISFLNEIINKFDRLHANQILNELKASVKKSLRQTGKDNEAKDGMDMALCMLDFEKMEMEFSGAYNSLILIRDNELIKYEADRMPVGIYVKDRGSFTNHVIEMKKGDNYYIFSDGYPDQFGGETGSKLMIRRFKKLLLDNHQLPAKHQKEALDSFLTEWQSYKNEDGNKYRQLDDILVIGMKV